MSPTLRRHSYAGARTPPNHSPTAQAQSAPFWFPEADIVAFDFSPASIAIANDLQRRRPGHPVRFLVADLGSRAVDGRVGRGFDLISCHGVLTYVPAPGRALPGSARCLAEGGALYLGVNGRGHASVVLRRTIAAFGIDVTRFVDRPEVRRIRAFQDGLLPPVARVARASAPYLASDVFGAFFQNLPLSAWVRLARRSGLHVHGDAASYHSIRRVAHRGHAGLPVPRVKNRGVRIDGYAGAAGVSPAGIGQAAPGAPSMGSSGSDHGLAAGSDRAVPVPMARARGAARHLPIARDRVHQSADEHACQRCAALMILPDRTA